MEGMEGMEVMEVMEGTMIMLSTMNRVRIQVMSPKPISVAWKRVANKLINITHIKEAYYARRIFIRFVDFGDFKFRHFYFFRI
jgi:hypothetical protein